MDTLDAVHRRSTKAFAPEERDGFLRRLEFHYTPKHASWLTMVEIEIGFEGPCLDRRVEEQKDPDS